MNGHVALKINAKFLSAEEAILPEISRATEALENERGKWTVRRHRLSGASCRDVIANWLADFLSCSVGRVVSCLGVVRTF